MVRVCGFVLPASKTLNMIPLTCDGGRGVMFSQLGGGPQGVGRGTGRSGSYQGGSHLIDCYSVGRTLEIHGAVQATQIRGNAL